MADLEIDNQHDFFKTVKLDSNGSIKVWIKTKYPSLENPLNQYDFYNDIEITEDGLLKIVIIK